MYECMQKKDKILGEEDPRTNLGGRERYKHILNEKMLLKNNTLPSYHCEEKKYIVSDGYEI